MCNMFRPLTAGEVECRVAQVGKTDRGGWASILIYKDARVDQKLLDEVVGPKNWKNDYEFINGSLYCTVSIWDEEKGEWISKQNVGTESNTEKEKGQASDAFKRACFNWGLGRELYTAPKIFIKLEQNEWDESNGKFRCKASFFVTEMNVNAERVIDRLVIVDKNNQVRFSYTAAVTLADVVKKAQDAKDAKALSAVWSAYKVQFGDAKEFVDAIKKNPNNPKR